MTYAEKTRHLLQSSPMISDLTNDEKDFLFATLSILAKRFGFENVLSSSTRNNSNNKTNKSHQQPVRIMKCILMEDIATKSCRHIDPKDRKGMYEMFQKRNLLREVFLPGFPQSSSEAHVVELHPDFRKSMDRRWLMENGKMESNKF